MDVQAYQEEPGLSGKDFFLSKKIKTNQFLGFSQKKRKEKKNQFLNYYYLNGINIKLYCLVYILKSQGVELIDKQK